LLHKGAVTIFSERNRGTDMVVELPFDIADYAADEIAEDNAATLPDGDEFAESAAESILMRTKKRILLMEDNDDLRRLIANFLSTHYDIVQTADGDEASEWLDTGEADLIIADIMVPGKDGISLCREVKENVDTSHIPFILLTAKTDIETKLEGTGSGADLYFEKPVDLDFLLLSIGNIFDRQSKLREYYWAWIEQAAWVDELETELRALSPGIIIGSRLRADERGSRHYDSNGDLLGDYDQTWERNMPETMAVLGGADWDCVMTIPENQWGYHSDWSLTHVKTSYELIEMMVKAVSMNGNFVLNFGPDGDGNIRPEESRIAGDIGEWMKTNGEAVHGCSNSSWERQPWGYYTQKGDNRLYLAVFYQPQNGKIRVKVPPAASREKTTVITRAYYLADGAAAPVADGGRDKAGNYYYDIDVPAENTGSGYVIALDIKEINRNERDAYQQALI